MIFEPSEICFHMIYISIWSYAWKKNNTKKKKKKKKKTIYTLKKSNPCSLSLDF